MTEHDETKPNKTGRPPKWATPEALRSDIDAYFASEENPSVMGLCSSIGCTRQTLQNYTRRGEEFASVVQIARLKIIGFCELVGQGVVGAGGALFADRMLTRMGWPCVEQSTQQQVTHIVSFGGCEDV